MSEKIQFECYDGLDIESGSEPDGTSYLTLPNGMIKNGNCRFQIESECNLEIKFNEFQVQGCNGCACDQIYPSGM